MHHFLQNLWQVLQERHLLLDLLQERHPLLQERHPSQQVLHSELPPLLHSFTAVVIWRGANRTMKKRRRWWLRFFWDWISLCDGLLKVQIQLDDVEMDRLYRSILEVAKPWKGGIVEWFITMCVSNFYRSCCKIWFIILQHVPITFIKATPLNFKVLNIVKSLCC